VFKAVFRVRKSRVQKQRWGAKNIKTESDVHIYIFGANSNKLCYLRNIRTSSDSPNVINLHLVLSFMSRVQQRMLQHA